MQKVIVLNRFGIEAMVDYHYTPATDYDASCNYYNQPARLLIEEIALAGRVYSPEEAESVLLLEEVKNLRLIDGWLVDENGYKIHEVSKLMQKQGRFYTQYSMYEDAYQTIWDSL